MKVFLLFMIVLIKQGYSYPSDSSGDFFEGREGEKTNLISLKNNIYSPSPIVQGSNLPPLNSDCFNNKGRIIYSKTLPLVHMPSSLNNQPSLFEPTQETIISLLTEEEEGEDENNEEDETQSISYSYKKTDDLAASFKKLHPIVFSKMK